MNRVHAPSKLSDLLRLSECRKLSFVFAFLRAKASSERLAFDHRIMLLNFVFLVSRLTYFVALYFELKLALVVNIPYFYDANHLSHFQNMMSIS
jgi:hypothetical protein